MWHGSWTGAHSKTKRGRDGEMATSESGHHDAHPATPTAHCHGNGQHQPSTCCPAARLAADSANPDQPLAPRYFGRVSKRTGLAHHQVRVFTLSAVLYDHDRDRLVASQQARSASQRVRSQIGIVTGLARLVRSAAGLPGCRGYGVTGRCASILRACLVKPAAETTNNHTHQYRCITSMDWNPAVNNASSDQKP